MSGRGKIPSMADRADPWVVMKMITGLGSVSGVVAVLQGIRDAESEDDFQQITEQTTERFRNKVAGGEGDKDVWQWEGIRRFVSALLLDMHNTLEGK